MRPLAYALILGDLPIDTPRQDLAHLVPAARGCYRRPETQGHSAARASLDLGALYSRSPATLMEIKIEITFCPAHTEGLVEVPSKLCLTMTEPGHAEPPLEDFSGENADKLFRGLYSQIESARLAGQYKCGTCQ